MKPSAGHKGIAGRQQGGWSLARQRSVGLAAARRTGVTWSLLRVYKWKQLQPIQRPAGVRLATPKASSRIVSEQERRKSHFWPDHLCRALCRAIFNSLRVMDVRLAASSPEAPVTRGKCYLSAGQIGPNARQNFVRSISGVPWSARARDSRPGLAPVSTLLRCRQRNYGHRIRFRDHGKKGTPKIGGQYLSEEASRHHPAGVVIAGGLGQARKDGFRRHISLV